MRLAKDDINIPEYWEHDPLLTNNDGYTVAMYYVYKGNNIPDKWKHDKLLKNKDRRTIAMMYAYFGHIPP